MKLKIYTDGACSGNPGICAIAFMILDNEDRTVKTYSEYIGKGTNNQAEYKALINALESAKYFGNELECYSDSKLLVNQMNGEWKVKHPNMKILWKTAIALKDTFHHISFTFVPRTNMYIQRVDQLANQTLDNLEKPDLKQIESSNYKQINFLDKRFKQTANKKKTGRTMGRPKESFRIPLGDGKTLSVAIFPTRKDPRAEVISVQVQKYEDEKWENIGKIAVYRSPEGNYSRLPDRDKPSE